MKISNFYRIGILVLMVATVVAFSSCTKTYHLTVEVNDPSMGTALGSGDYEPNSEVTIRANANSGYMFSRWNDGNTDNPRTITVTQDTTFTALFALDDTIGIEAADRLTFSLYPNPATGRVAITCGQHCEVIFMDIAGREVLRSVCKEGVTTIDVSTLAPGTYFVRMSDTSLSPVRKLIIK